MLISPQERLGIFIDGADLLTASRALGFSVDFKRLRSLFQERGKLIRTVFYATLSEDDNGECSMRPLIDWLQYNGYSTSTKATRRRIAGQPCASGAMDVEIAVDAIRLGRALDHVILFSGRAELKALVFALQEEGKRVTVVSTLATGALVVDEMRRQADQYVDLAELKDQIRLPVGSTTPKQ
ncbi:LabA-like NYN domain-containing protein [Hyphomicrobium album]|nr:NYN domain-containing protein [Hyphomicrobium album]